MSAISLLLRRRPSRNGHKRGGLTTSLALKLSAMRRWLSNSQRPSETTRTPSSGGPLARP